LAFKKSKDMDEIVNKVEKSGLIQLDLADFKPNKPIYIYDLAQNLWQGLALKEKDFRAFVKDHDWNQYINQVVGVTCSADAIVPTWAYMLVIAKLQEAGVQAFVGDEKDVIKELIRLNIHAYQHSQDEHGRYIIKGCSDIPDPAFAMSELTKHLMPFAKSIMYGEPCSTVPVYKAKKK
jgi:hypothetical protein